MSRGRHTSGVTVGVGVDLGNFGNLDALNLPAGILEKLKPYEGLRGEAARQALEAKPLVLTEEEATKISSATKDYIEQRVSRLYNRDSSSGNWKDIPEEARTAIMSVAYNHGPNPSGFPVFWRHVTMQDWEGAVNELKNFYSDKEHSLQPRRSREAQLLEQVVINDTITSDDDFSRRIPAYRMQSSLDEPEPVPEQEQQQEPSSSPRGSLQELKRQLDELNKDWERRAKEMNSSGDTR